MRRIIACLTLCCLSVLPVEAADTFSLYTNVCYNVEGGDLLGLRIGILRLGEGPYVYFQQAEGNWSAPAVAKMSAEDLKRGQIFFRIMDGGPPLSFRGTVTEKFITGRFDGMYNNKGGPLAIRLKRVAPSVRGGLDCS